MKEDSYRVLFQGAAAGILLADIETRRFAYANPAISRMLGYTEAELTRIGVADIHPPDALDHVISEFEAQARGAKTLAPSIPCLRKDGTIMYADINTAKVAVDGREYNLGLITDVTNRKEATEQALRESEQRRRSLTSNIPDVVMTVTRDGTIMAINHTVKGFSEKETIGTSIYDYIVADEHNKVKKSLDQAFQTGRPGGYEILGTGPQGPGTAWYETRIVPTELDGKISTAMLISTDITERKRAQMVLEQRNTALVNANEELKELHRAKDELLAAISHELRAPLVTGLGYIELLLDGQFGPVTAGASEVMEIARRNLKRLSVLIDDVLDYHSLTAGKRFGNLSCSAFNLGTCCRDCATEFLFRSGRTAGSLSVEIPAGLPSTWGDENRIRQVLSNLLDNAGRHAGRDAHIRLSVRRAEAGGLEVSVADDGVGVPEEIKARAFEPFVKSTGSPGGTGLGLAIVHDILEAHGCTVSLESAQGKGTTISFVLPDAGPGAADPGRRTREGVPVESTPSARVLIVDDDEDTLGFLTAVLGGRGYRVDTVLSGDQALAAIQQDLPDLAILDFTLPGMDGAELCGRIKTNPSTAGLPVCMLTARAEKGPRAKSHAMGCDAYLVKPAAVDELVKTVQRLVAAPRSPEGQDAK